MAEKVDYELTEAEAAILDSATQEALARAGAKGGAVGGAIGGGVGGGLGGGAPGGAGGALGGRIGGRSGGASGGRLGARLLKPRTAETLVEVDRAPAVTLDTAKDAIREKGEVIDDPNGAGDEAVWGLVASGHLDMVPALVRVQADGGASGCRVHIRATGKEGLIKQRIGAKAADRIAGAIARPA
jgi:hypothetical protein